MAKPSEIKIANLINLFEPKLESKPGERLQKALVQHTKEEQEDITPRENSEAQDTVVHHVVIRDFLAPSVYLASSHHKNETINGTEETAQQSINEFAVQRPKPRHPEKPNRLKELEEQLKISLNENETLRSEVCILTEKLETMEASFEALKNEHKKQLEDSFKQNQLEETTKLIQKPYTDGEELRSAQNEAAKEKQTRIEMEKCLKEANIKISELTKLLEEKDEQMMLYKKDHEDHIKAQEDLEKEKQLPLELSGQLSEANEKNVENVQQLDTFTNKPNLEIHQHEIELFERQMRARKKPLKFRDNGRVVLSKAPGELDRETQREKQTNNSEKETPDSLHVHSLPFSEILDVCHPVPNLRYGFNRPKRKKHHVAATSAGALVRSNEQVNDDMQITFK